MQLEPEQRLDKLQEFTKSSSQIETDDVSASATVLVATTRDVEGNRTLSENFLNVVDNIVRADPDVLQASQTMANSSAKLLGALERVSESIPILENETLALVTQTTFAVSVHKVDSETFNGLHFSAVLGNFSSQQIDKNALLFNTMSSDRPTGSLSLPSNLLDKANSTRVTLSVFNTNALFLRRRKVNLNEIGSIVIAAGVVGTRRVENLNPPVVTVFQRNPEVNGSNPVCSFWNQALDDGYGGWSPAGCITVNSSNSTDNASSGHVTCMCNHLTNFAILLDVSPHFGITMTPDEPVDFFLDAVSYIGVILSVFGLLLTIISYVITKKLRHSDHGQLLLNLCLALLGLYVAFIFSVHSSGVVVLCTIVSVVLHYFMLVVFMVMAAEAIHLYMKLVVVLGHTISHYVFKATIICWITPVFVVLFCFAPSPKSYMHPNMCRVYGIPFYIGLIAPFIIIYLFNWVVYVIILCSLFCKCSCRKEDERSNRVTTRQQLIAAVILSVLFGLGWGIGLIATEGIMTKAVRDLFSALFIICTAFQGVMVFCLQTLRSKKVRDTWLSLFYKATGKNITTWCLSRHSNSHSQSQFDSSTLRQGFGLKSNDYENVTLPKNSDAFDVKDTTFSHKTVDEKLEENNDEKRGEPCSPSSPPSLSKIKETFGTKEPMKAANHQEDMEEERSPSHEENETVHIEPNNSTFSVEEVQIRFGDSPTPTFETQITEKVQSVAANGMKCGNITTENDDGLSSADADKY